MTFWMLDYSEAAPEPAVSDFAHPRFSPSDPALAGKQVGQFRIIAASDVEVAGYIQKCLGYQPPSRKLAAMGFSPTGKHWAICEPCPSPTP